MKTVQTLTVNGETYTISDQNAVTKEEIGDISAALEAIREHAQNLIDGGAGQ